MTEITYSQLIAYTRPFFLSRGWDAFATLDRMMFYANAALQDVYNSDNSTFRHKTEKLTAVSNWDTNKFITEFPIMKIQEAFDQFGSPIVPTLFIMKDCELRFEWNQILTNTKVTSLEVSYLVDYVWASYPKDLTSWITVPNRYVPAVIKMMYDWASPVNLMASESQTTDFFSHWITRMNKLADNDSLSDYPAVNPAY
jgi:hypothetical protein